MEHVDSYYAATSAYPHRYEPLRGRLDTDVCVIGGGFTGVSSALHLAERGYKVVLLEAARIGWGAAGRNGGELFNGQRRSQEDLEDWFGPDIARQLWGFGLEAVELVVERVRRHGIRCDLKPGIISVGAKQRDEDYLRNNLARLRDHYGYTRMRFLDRDETIQRTGTTRYQAGVLDEGCYHLHPLNLVQGMAAAATQAGAQIFEQSRVQSYDRGEPAHVRTHTGEVQARYIVLACDAYLENLEPRIAGKILPINNYMLATEPFSEEAARALIPDDVAVCDTKFVVNYWRFSADHRLLFGGGENYTRDFPRDIKSFVRRFLLKVYPRLDGVRIDHGWGGAISVTLRRLPQFGRLHPNLFFVQGYSGQGIALGNFAGRIMAEAVAGTAERFDVLARLPTPSFPGGRLLRYPGMVLGMLYYSLLDKL